MKIREVIERDLTDEPQSVVKVYETAKLKVDFQEYVLTDQLSREFAKVLEPIVESASPAGRGRGDVGIWVSGFFGSGKSHFGKVMGHLVANTRINGSTAREMFRKHLRPGRPGDDAVAEWLQQAETHPFDTVLVPFDIATTFSPDDAGNVGRTFLRKLYETSGLSRIIPFAQRELELKRNGQYDDFLTLFEKKTGRSWEAERHLASSISDLALCLTELLPERHTSQEAALQALNFDLEHQRGMSIDDVVRALLRWLDDVEGEANHPVRLLFVADEIGAWCGRDRKRIEQIRGFVEGLGVLGQGRIWLVATSQEKLSEVALNAPDQDDATAKDLQQRLEARFRLNVHLESSEVGTVIENRVLAKKPTARPELEELWKKHQAQLAGIAESPGVEIGGNYPGPELENFIRDYPFLPYQIPASADLFGAMRGPKVSSGARTMIEVVFDSISELADDDLGRVVSWDQIFDSANNDNEFQDEQYLGSQGLNYLLDADKHVQGTAIRPSRVLKVLWLVQQSQRIPRTVSNVARLLIRNLGDDVLQLERDLEETLQKLEAGAYVRFEAATEQWRFLTQDQVTVEKIVSRISADLKERDLRREREALFGERLLGMVNGKVNHGKSVTTFDYGIYLGETGLKNESAPVQLRVALEATTSAENARKNYSIDLEAPVVYWIVASPSKLDARLKRTVAIGRLESDDEFRRVATERTKAEAKELLAEADMLRTEAVRDVLEALENGELLWGGQTKQLGKGSARGARAVTTSAKAEVERAIRDRIDAKYPRFVDGDHEFNERNVEKLLTAAPADRRDLDPDLGFFSPHGELLADHPVLKSVIHHLTQATKNSGKDLIDRFRQPPYGWPADLTRYAVAALFVGNRLYAIDPGGKLIDDPRSPGARSIFGTGPFRSHRFEVEEEPLTPEERKDARDFLSEVGVPPPTDGEGDLRDATLKAAAEIAKLTINVGKAKEAGLPLPPVYEMVEPILDDLEPGNSPTKLIRTLLSHSENLRQIKMALDSLASFVKRNGLAQYSRSQELLAQAISAGLTDEPTVGRVISEAAQQYESIRQQNRVLEEWDRAFTDRRAKVVEAYSSVYRPLREEAAARVAEARSVITSMEEFEALEPPARARVTEEFLADGRGLAELTAPDIHGDEQLVLATRQVSIPFLRQTLAALPGQVNLAKTRILELYAQKPGPETKRITVWNPDTVFSGAEFNTEDEVDMVFDEAKEDVKTLIRDGRVVRII